MAGTISGKDRRANGIIAGIIVVALGLIVGSVLWQYMGAFFLAVTGYVFFSPLYRALRQRGIGKTASGWITLIVAAVVIGIACLFTITVLANEMANLFDPVALSNSANSLSASVSRLNAFLPGYLNAAQVQQFISSAMLEAANFLRASVVSCLQSVGSLALSLLIIVFTFYYLLVAEGSIGKAREVIPFSRKNTETLIREFKKILYSSIICTGLMAIAQAAPLTLVFIYFNVPGAIILGFIAAGNGLAVSNVQNTNLTAIAHWLPLWTVIPSTAMILAGLVSNLDSKLASIASLAGHDLINRQLGGMTHNETHMRMFAQGAMVLLVFLGIMIANIPGITVLYLFLFYGTLRAATLLPTVITLIRHHAFLSEKGMFYGILASLCIGLPLFSYAGANGLTDLKIAGSLISVGASGCIVLITGLLRIR